jgi:putative hydrolase of HD superfamily
MKSKINQSNRVADFLYEVGSLRRVIRSHRQSLFVDDTSDTISSHSYRVTMIGWFLAKEEKVDPYKVVMMCMTHDLSEARTGDQNWVNKRYVKSFEEEAIKDQFKDLRQEKELNEIAKEYGDRKTKESIVAKEADLIDQILILREHEWSGNREATKWLKDCEQFKMLKTKTGKNIARSAMKIDPTHWWKNVWTSKRR